MDPRVYELDHSGCILVHRARFYQGQTQKYMLDELRQIFSELDWIKKACINDVISFYNKYNRVPNLNTKAELLD